MARLRYFAAAAEAAGVTSESVEAPTLGVLRDLLVERHGIGFGRVLGRCSMLIDGVNTSDPNTPLVEDTLVDVLPPFAGG